MLLRRLAILSLLLAFTLCGAGVGTSWSLAAYASEESEETTEEKAEEREAERLHQYKVSYRPSRPKTTKHAQAVSPQLLGKTVAKILPDDDAPRVASAHLDLLIPRAPPL